MPTLPANGIDIYYEVHSPAAPGAGSDRTPLLLITGLGLNSLSWKKNLPGLCANRTVIVFDNRGSGRSSRPDQPYSLTQMAADTVALLECLQVRRAHVFGFSLGSLIAQEVALRYPHKVKSLILGASTAGGVNHVVSPPGVIERMVERGWVDPSTAAEMVIPIVYSRRFIARNMGEIEADTLNRLVYPTPAYAYRRQMMAATYHDTYDRLDQLPMPTLLITGDEDLLVVPGNSERMSRRIPRSRLAVLPGVGHYFTSEEPHETSRLVLNFLDSLYRPGPSRDYLPV